MQALALDGHSQLAHLPLPASRSADGISVPLQQAMQDLVARMELQAARVACGHEPMDELEACFRDLLQHTRLHKPDRFPALRKHMSRPLRIASHAPRFRAFAGLDLRHDLVLASVDLGREHRHRIRTLLQEGGPILWDQQHFTRTRVMAQAMQLPASSRQLQLCLHGDPGPEIGIRDECSHYLLLGLADCRHMSTPAIERMEDHWIRYPYAVAARNYLETHSYSTLVCRLDVEEGDQRDWYSAFSSLARDSIADYILSLFGEHLPTGKMAGTVYLRGLFGWTFGQLLAMVSGWLQTGSPEIAILHTVVYPPKAFQSKSQATSGHPWQDLQLNGWNGKYQWRFQVPE